ncbi:hypothetical protein FEI13_08545 [Halomonas urmiana]|uniref:Uncharacterized protein n=1 Tax=Halomonas urmiana TaxID=490901 RepID=A0A5R8MHR4_9GAMM|nr:hypothetical protein [Halomonas urmiana]TLF50720.1 hypothetical protein FEI13_08545 [Halomonas urmiana]
MEAPFWHRQARDCHRRSDVELPALFGRSAVALVLCALVLVLLTPLIGRMLKGSQPNAAASSPFSFTTGA